MGGGSFSIATNFGIMGFTNFRRPTSSTTWFFTRVYGFHLQGFKGEAVALYRDPLVTKQMEAIGVGNI
jgi:hypothetical protein